MSISDQNDFPTWAATDVEEGVILSCYLGVLINVFVVRRGKPKDSPCGFVIGLGRVHGVFTSHDGRKFKVHEFIMEMPVLGPNRPLICICRVVELNPDY